jgi:hypothetical protein
MKSNTIYFALTIILGIGIAGVSFYSCEKEDITPISERTTPLVEVDDAQQTGTNPGPPEEYIDSEYLPGVEGNCGKTFIKPLNVRGIEVGSVKVSNDQESYIIEVESNENYKLKRGFMHIAFNMDKFPLTEKGNPDYKNFTYMNRNPSEQNTMKFVVPLKFIKLDMFLTSLVCEVINVPIKPDTQPEPTGEVLMAWVKGQGYGDTKPGTAFIYKKQNCLSTDGESNNLEK